MGRQQLFSVGIQHLSQHGERELLHKGQLIACYGTQLQRCECAEWRYVLLRDKCCGRGREREFLLEPSERDRNLTPFVCRPFLSAVVLNLANRVSFWCRFAPPAPCSPA